MYDFDNLTLFGLRKILTANEAVCHESIQATKVLTLYTYCGRVPAANVPGSTAAEGLLYKPWSLVVSTCTARCLHQRP